MYLPSIHTIVSEYVLLQDSIRRQLLTRLCLVIYMKPRRVHDRCRMTTGFLLHLIIYSNTPGLTLTLTAVATCDMLSFPMYLVSYCFLELGLYSFCSRFVLFCPWVSSSVITMVLIDWYCNPPCSRYSPWLSIACAVWWIVIKCKYYVIWYNIEWIIAVCVSLAF